MKTELEKCVIAIGGMTCDECVKKVTSALQSVEGVRVESVVIGRAIVQVDDPITCQRACDAIDEVGYSATAEDPSTPFTEQGQTKTALQSQNMVSEGGNSAAVNSGRDGKQNR